MPRFTISGYSRSNVPEINVAFENGKTHEMILEPFSESSCNFIGELKSEPGSSVGVTGCLENPDDKMYITLLSDDNSLSYAYIMDYDGKVTADENPFKNQKGFYITKQFHIDFCIYSNDGVQLHITECTFRTKWTILTRC